MATQPKTAQPNYARRLAQTRVRLESEQLDGLLVANHHNRRYLTGFPTEDHDIVETAGWALVTPKRLALVTTTFAIIGLEATVTPSRAEVLRFDTRSAWEIVAETAAEDGVQRLGFEASYFSYERYDRLRTALRRRSRRGGPRVEMVPAKSVIEHVRALKDPAEVAAIRKAGAIAEEAFERLVPTLRPGMTEREIARRLETLMVDQGALGPSFPTIVAAGQNAAQPHAVAGDRQVRAGEPLLIDFGAYADGYCSDFTRTITLGEPEPRLVDLYAIVREAQSAAERALAEGVRRGRDVDHAAREVIEKAGYGDHYLHGTGHGVGMAVHELPSLTRARPDRGLTSADLAKIEHLEPGHVVTVEPGIYLEDWGGVRLEDMLLITESGATVLNERNPERVRVVA